MSMSKKTKKKVNSLVEKQVKKTSKKFSIGSIVAIICCLVVGVVGGIFIEKLITKNDCFVVNGNKNFSIQIGESFTYSDEGCKCVSFGKDISDKIKVDTNLTKNTDGTYSIDTSYEGDYYMIYTVESKKFGKIKRVRTFTVGVSNE